MTPKLLQRMAAEGFYNPVSGDVVLEREAVSKLGTAPIIVADGAAKGFIQKWHLPGASFDGPNYSFQEHDKDIEFAAPPFDAYWMEGDGASELIRTGAMFIKGEMEGNNQVMFAFVAYAERGRRIIYPCCVFRYVVLPDGRQGGEWKIFPMPGVDFNNHSVETVARTIVSPYFAVHNLLHCTNVRLAEQEIKDPQSQKKLAKRFGDREGGYRFHVLKIRPPGARVASVATGEEDVMPLHTCRGHYKCYGPEWGTKPLFGKYVGRFFWHAHARGNEKNGVVDKDYAVDAAEWGEA